MTVVERLYNFRKNVKEKTLKIQETNESEVGSGSRMQKTYGLRSKSELLPENIVRKASSTKAKHSLIITNHNI